MILMVSARPCMSKWGRQSPVLRQTSAASCKIPAKAADADYRGSLAVSLLTVAQAPLRRFIFTDTALLRLSPTTARSASDCRRWQSSKANRGGSQPFGSEKLPDSLVGPVSGPRLQENTHEVDASSRCGAGFGPLGRRDGAGHRRRNRVR